MTQGVTRPSSGEFGSKFGIRGRSYLPFTHAINIDPTFAVEHPPIVSKEQWIQGNVMLLSELGTENWLQLLLNVLEGDFVTAKDMELTAPPPSAGRIRYHISKQKGKKRKKHKK